MDRNTGLSIGYHIRTAAGFFLILAGLTGGLWLAWWFIFRGDIIEILRTAKAGLPGWAWVALKFGLSGAFGVIFILAFIMIGMIVLGSRGRH
jgi:hypothetical protein